MLRFRAVIPVLVLFSLACKREPPSSTPTPPSAPAAVEASSSAKKPEAPLNVPAEVRARVEAVLGALGASDWPKVRAELADEFYWSFGDAPSADEAIQQLQGSATMRAELKRALEAGCARDKTGDAILCPPQAVAEDYVDYRARFDRSAGWKMTSFVAGD